ncbi:MAG: hypothetical protein NC126_00035 [Clostridium sp.]|nr:hypothetical protein [Clostridium sp.]
MYRDRAAGWQHAKLSGHSNEALVKKLLDTDEEYGREFMERLGLYGETIASTSIGGLHETNVSSVLGRTTKSKTDLKIQCVSGREIRISVKKSMGGQVYLIKAESFMEVFETQFEKRIPCDVKRAIKLFWAAADDALPIIREHGDTIYSKAYNLQVRHKSLNADTLRRYDEALYGALLGWFADNIYEITKLCFSMGAACDAEEWSDYVWYINLLGECNIDEIFCIEDICEAAERVTYEQVYYGSSNGGTTIQLPFGFVQWHQSSLQFHHSYDKVSGLVRGL